MTLNVISNAIFDWFVLSCQDYRDDDEESQDQEDDDDDQEVDEHGAGPIPRSMKRKAEKSLEPPKATARRRPPPPPSPPPPKVRSCQYSLLCHLTSLPAAGRAADLVPTIYYIHCDQRGPTLPAIMCHGQDS